MERDHRLQEEENQRIKAIKLQRQSESQQQHDKQLLIDQEKQRKEEYAISLNNSLCS